MKILASLLAAVWLLAACGNDAAPLTASDVRVTRPVPGSEMSAGYFELVNNTPDPVRIERVTSPQFGKVEMHETTIENGVARMVGLDGITIQGNSSVVFEPGGMHLMLMRPVADIASTTLEFHSDGALLLAVTVEVSE